MTRTQIDHVCGMYYFASPPLGGASFRPPQRRYLPQVSLAVHTRIISFASRTTLHQTFVNPSTTNVIPELRYVFPLYDGVSVVGFVCTINEDRVIRGVVEERAQAKATFEKAIARGETAGLLEQLPDASDVFSTTLGNIPAGARIRVDITYLGELKHDAEIDGIRFTIPTKIAPRYGSYPGELSKATLMDTSGGITIVVDVEMPLGSNIQKIQSPSHPISVSIGNISTATRDSEMSLQKASASLCLASSPQLEQDFVLQVLASNLSNPVAMLETHESMPNQRALMATLVPKFNLPPSRPEIVFVCDRSGSMGEGVKIPNLKTALHIFLKSLPLGVKFNICSFGSRHSFLFDRSRSYDATSIEEATRHVDTFLANYGGTEIDAPLEATFKNRYSDMDLEIFLLTDGQVWNQERIFSMVNQYVAESKGAIRVFTLGVGQDASHSLIEGISRAGNGFSQTVTATETMNTKVVRMLKAALTPHIDNYTLEVKYKDTSASESSEEEFEIVEKVMDSLRIDVEGQKAESKLAVATQTPATKAPISLFSLSADPDVEMQDDTTNSAGNGKYSHLVTVSEPSILQTPFAIPTLYSFNRVNVYLLLSPGTAQKTPTSVILRAKSIHGPLELEIPVSALAEKGETIHQLAARNSVKELEEGRGWIFHARDSVDNKLLRERYEGRFSDMVEREAVRLGVKFQVGSKWCSFVAVENDTKTECNSQVRMPGAPHASHAPDMSGSHLFPMRKAKKHMSTSQPPTPMPRAFMAVSPLPVGEAARLSRAPIAPALPPPAHGAVTLSASAASAFQPVDFRYGRSASNSVSSPQASGVGISNKMNSDCKELPKSSKIREASSRLFAPRTRRRGCKDEESYMEGSAKPGAPKFASTQLVSSDPLAKIVTRQQFSGAWEWNDDLLNTLGLGALAVKFPDSHPDLSHHYRTNILATVLVLLYLHQSLHARRDEWEMLADKAMDWAKKELESRSEKRGVQEYLSEAEKLFDTVTRMSAEGQGIRQ